MSPGGLPDLSRDPTLTGWERYARVPVFFFARHALAGSHFLVDAAMRERGGFAARKRAKRAF
jgi:hypothetical protein